MIFLLFILGLCVGSFVNVLIDRIPAGKSVLFGRSQCDFCHHVLSPLDLIPVFSYVFLQGKCRYCHKKLSFQYPLVELCTGIAFAAVYFLEMQTVVSWPLLIIDLCLVTLGISLTIMDIKYHMLSDALLVFFAIFVSLRLVLINPSLIQQHILVGILSSIPLLLIFLITRGRGMGFGDVKLIFALGLLTGYPDILIAYYIAFLTGAIVGVILIIARKKRLHGSRIAFGPFLFLGAIIALLWGNTIWIIAKNFLNL